MAAIIHVASNFGEYTNGAGIAVPLLSTTASAARQTANARIALLARTSVSEALSPVWTSARADFWFHCVIYSEGQAVGSTGNSFLTFYDATSGDPQLRLIHTKTSDEIQVQYYDGSWNNIGAVFVLTADVRYRMDIHVVFHASAGSVNVYLNESLEMAYSGAVNSTALRADRVLFQSSFNSSAADKYISEVVVADYDTRGWNVVEMFPSSNGAVTGWSGDYTLVDEAFASNIDIMSTDPPNAISTFYGADLPSGPASQDILAVVVAITANVSPDGAIADLQPVLRLSSTNYPGSSLLFDEGVSTRQAVYTTDPSTSLAWVASDVNNLEYGVKAV